MTEFLRNFWRPPWLAEPASLHPGAANWGCELSSHCVWGPGFYWGTLAASGVYNSPHNTWELL